MIPRRRATRSVGLSNPEDMAILPGLSWIVVSEMAAGNPATATDEAPFEAGRLSALRFGGLERLTLYPLDDSAPAAPTSSGPFAWGDAACPGPPDPKVFQPHGIDVGTGPDGRATLLVVNHGGREAIELFEIMAGREPTIAWRGCVPMRAGRTANDVAFLPGGGFVVTNFMPAFEGLGPTAIWNMLKISVGAQTGSVLRWQPGGSLEEIENSEGSAPNGVVASPDGTEIYVAEWGAGRVYRLRIEGRGAAVREEVALETQPDNLTWTRDGRLLVAGQYGGVADAIGCGEIRHAGCDIGYAVYLVEPIGLEAQKITEGRGAASVALEVADEIYVGAFVGDQIARIPGRSLGGPEAGAPSAR